MLEPFILSHLRIAPYHERSQLRYLFPDINWQARAIALLGARGVGKTTLLFQYAKTEYDDPRRCLYVLGDDANVLRVELPVLVDAFVAQGGEVLLLDEVHKYPDWNQVVKNIYDKYPGLQLVISGSSQIDLIRQKYDLSRRLVTYHLRGMSLREYVNWESGTAIEPVALETLLSDHLAISQDISQTLHAAKGLPILRQFADYLRHGYYPYYRESVGDFPSKLRNAVEKVLYEDIPVIADLPGSSTATLKKLLSVLGSSQPFTVDITSLANTLGVARPTVYVYLDYLIQAQLLEQARQAGSGNKSARKPAKLYLHHPNLYYVLGEGLEFSGKLGTIRESFALNQLHAKHQVTVPKSGDFLIDERVTLEIGGAAKSARQLKQSVEGYVLSDGIEYGFDKKIPLYLLGFLY